MQNRILVMEELTLFAFPLVLPVLTSIPIAYLCGKIVEFRGYKVLIPQRYGNAAMIALALILFE